MESKDWAWEILNTEFNEFLKSKDIQISLAQRRVCEIIFNEASNNEFYTFFFDRRTG